MHAHLTNEELTDRLLGDPSMTIEAHLLECADCRKELSHLKESIGLFRGAAQEWSENAAMVRRLSQREVKWTMPRWAIAVVAMLLLVVLPGLYLRKYRPGRAKVSPVTTVTTQTQIDEDNQLLSEVNSEISEGVPAPMQPLQLSYSTNSSAAQTK
jgi:predicted anti-sigma-YlaC factor YlaD